MTRPDSVGGPGENDSDADPDMAKSDDQQPAEKGSADSQSDD